MRLLTQKSIAKSILILITLINSYTKTTLKLFNLHLVKVHFLIDIE